MKIRAFIHGIGCIVLMCTVSACAFTLTHKEPFQQYINRPLTLKHDMGLYDRRRGVVTFWSGGANLKPGELYTMTELNGIWDWGSMKGEYYDKLVVRSGAAMTISRIYSNQNDSGYEIRVFGEVYIEELGKSVPFLYLWPMDEHYQRQRPVWEN